MTQEEFKKHFDKWWEEEKPKNRFLAYTNSVKAMNLYDHALRELIKKKEEKKDL